MYTKCVEGLTVRGIAGVKKGVAAAAIARQRRREDEAIGTAVSWGAAEAALPAGCATTLSERLPNSGICRVRCLSFRGGRVLLALGPLSLSQQRPRLAAFQLHLHRDGFGARAAGRVRAIAARHATDGRRSRRFVAAEIVLPFILTRSRGDVDLRTRRSGTSCIGWLITR